MNDKLCKINHFHFEEFDENMNLKHAVKKIAFKIQYTLKKNNLNQKDLADLLDVTPQNISKLLKGEDYKVSTLVNIEEALNIRLIDREIKNNISSSVFIEIKDNDIKVLNTKIKTLNNKNYQNIEFESFINELNFTKIIKYQK
ncbi:helix-turn-helix domain-containing protein [Empedobacter brevis]